MMDPNKISERTRRQLEALPPEKRAKVEAILARTHTPEFRDRMNATRELLDREYRETGRIATVGESLSPSDSDHIKEFLMNLRREREARGLSLSDVAERSGIDKAALSRLESGKQPNPTVNTLMRYARAIDRQMVLAIQGPTAEPRKTTS